MEDDPILDWVLQAMALAGGAAGFVVGALLALQLGAWWQRVGQVTIWRYI